MGDLLLTRSGDMGACRNALCRQAICGTTDKHIVFGFHGYPWPVHRLTYRRTNRNLHVRGYEEEGTITTPFDMRAQNDLDRFRLIQDVIDRLPDLGSPAAYLKQHPGQLIEHKRYINAHGQDQRARARQCPRSGTGSGTGLVMRNGAMNCRRNRTPRELKWREDCRMAKIGQLELDAQRAQLVTDVKHLVEKYRAIFGWDVPEVDQGAAGKLILAAICEALEDAEQDLPA